MRQVTNYKHIRENQTNHKNYFGILCIHFSVHQVIDTLNCLILDEEKILDSLPSNMKRDVALAVHMTTLSKVTNMCIVLINVFFLI